jgi:hypothetical protein
MGGRERERDLLLQRVPQAHDELGTSLQCGPDHVHAGGF